MGHVPVTTFNLILTTILELKIPEVLIETFASTSTVNLLKNVRFFHTKVLAFFQEFFQGAISIVMQISFDMLIFYCSRTKFQGGGAKVPEKANCFKGCPLTSPVEESQGVPVSFQGKDLVACCAVSLRTVAGNILFCKGS